MTATKIIEAIAKHASDNDAIFLQRFFKTGPGQYGEGDVFIGVRVPQTRKVCKDFKNLSANELKKLLASPVHEHRLAATIIMSGQYKKADPTLKQQLFDLYLSALDQNQINNWDIVDTSCEHIVGAYAKERGDKILFDLASSDKLWHKRVAIISCFAWVRKKQVGPTIELAEILWPEKHDLLQKAVGWMLREVGKYVDESLLIDFLDRHAHEMPRTCLRYAIEKLTPQQRTYYMKMGKS
jgi:3-methyladenine DNA glycosylase AlkD